MTPSDTRVSIVVDPWRPATKAALWKVHAPQVVMGIDAMATTHCQPTNCQAGTIDKSMAISQKGMQMISRRLRFCA